MTPGNTIRERRLSLGLSQRKLAQQTGFDWSQISRWENGRVSPGQLCAVRLAVALGGKWQDYTLLNGRKRTKTQEVKKP